MTNTLFDYPDAEDIAKDWLTNHTSVAALVMRNGKAMIFEAMPKGAPLPVVVLSRAGGSVALKDVPYDNARISFSVWAANRVQAKAIKKALVRELGSVDSNLPVLTTYGLLESAQPISDVWLPDPASDQSRYVVDALMLCRAI